MHTISRIAAVLIALFAAVLISPTPAHADGTKCLYAAGSVANRNEIFLCLLDDVTARHTEDEAWGVTLKSGLGLGALVTASTTKCRVTMRAMLDRPGSNPWSSNAHAQSCNQSVAKQGSGELQTYTHEHVVTGATDINTVVCVDFFFNGSPTSGRQICQASGWHQLSFDRTLYNSPVW